MECVRQWVRERQGQKRKLLLNALVNAYSPELYQKSMTTRLLAIMDNLTYGDLHYLMSLKGGPDDAPTPWRYVDDLQAYHATQLVKHELVHRRRAHTEIEVGDDAAILTGLGKWMIKLIQDPKTADL